MSTRRLLPFALTFVLSLAAACRSPSPRRDQGIPAPPGTPLAQIQPDMSDTQVRKILGDPDDSNGYITGKSFVPFYGGTDTSRTDWIYRGQGRVVFSRNRYSGNLKVIRVDYDPNEGAPAGR